MKNVFLSKILMRMDMPGLGSFPTLDGALLSLPVRT